jgi:hypothetical protein
MTVEHPNVGQQFLDRIQPLLAKMRGRPVSNNHEAPGYSIVTRVPNSTFNSQAYLFHDGDESGHVTWNPETGFVTSLEVDAGHRHMTAKLLQEAWDHSTANGAYGPAWSHDLNQNSARLMSRWNPKSEGYKRYRRDNPN